MQYGIINKADWKNLIEERILEISKGLKYH